MKSEALSQIHMTTVCLKKLFQSSMFLVFSHLNERHLLVDAAQIEELVDHCTVTVIMMAMCFLYCCIISVTMLS